mmetsp:Transcript_17306/g.41021  ORF Transcript_17306/g.41021 Transcript_17306/m.41021 type:complete len:329 (-) Transcript_17306:76-1062(-)
MVDSTILVGNDLLDGGVHHDLSASLLNVLLHRLAETIGLVAIKEGHLQTVRLVEEAVHGGKDDRHGKLIGINEVEGLGHGNKNLLVDALRHAKLPHEVSDGELVLSINKVLPLDEHGNERRSGLDLLAEGKHLLVHENGQTEVEGSRNSGDEVEGGELSGKLLHGKDHLVDLPLETIMDTELSKNIHHVRVGTEEDMKSSLDPVSVLILPGRDLAAEDIAGLVDGGLVSSIDQILGAGETREATADDGDLLLLLGRGLEVRTEALGHGLGIAVVVRILDVGLGIVAHHQVGGGRLVNSAGRGGHRRQAGVRHECRASLRRGGDCRRKG